jgi:hypothetical protein
MNPHDPKILSAVAVYWVKLAENQKGLAAIERARRLAPSDGAVGYKAVVVYELAGRRARALEVLGGVLASGYSVEEIRREPELAQLRRDPRCEQILKGR